MKAEPQPCLPLPHVQGNAATPGAQQVAASPDVLARRRMRRFARKDGERELGDSGTAGAWPVRPWHGTRRRHGHRRPCGPRRLDRPRLSHEPARKEWRNGAATFDAPRVQRLQTAMAAWIGARSLSRAEFERRLVGRPASDAAIDSLRAAAEAVRTATTHQDLDPASAYLASAMQGISLARWPGFLGDAANLADTYTPSAGDRVFAQAATNTATDASPGTGANDGLSMSAQGLADLRQREGQHPGGGYYNDTAENCTYGTGILAHGGPCTDEELRRVVNPQQAEAEFQRRIAEAERRVRAQVPDRRLTQNQFDSLVSTALNTGNRDNRALFDAVNREDDALAQSQRGDLVHTHDHDARGQRVGPPRRDRGLVNRRRAEQEQYDRPDGVR